jgi:hypothetical protein
MSAEVERTYPIPYSHPSNTTHSEHVLAMPDHVVLTSARLKKGYTLQEVADQAKINIRQYQKFESGERDFRSTSFSLGLLVCRILDIDPQYFL